MATLADSTFVVPFLRVLQLRSTTVVRHRAFALASLALACGTDPPALIAAPLERTAWAPDAAASLVDSTPTRKRPLRDVE